MSNLYFENGRFCLCRRGSVLLMLQAPENGGFSRISGLLTKDRFRHGVLNYYYPLKESIKLTSKVVVLLPY
ncbi:hypothetical protein ACFOG5_08230 [Pedobacter fastidiosus]|uniref:hypothetical protein n=1 Tax=Pedobacter fastidiosus TaxID=2765361 RepID=UPI00360CDEF4